VKAFSTIPFFRILIPFLLGIGVGIAFELLTVHWAYILLPALGVSVLSVYGSLFKRQVLLLLLLGDLFLFFFGARLVEENRIVKQELFYGNQFRADQENTLIAVLDELPVKKEKFIKCSVTVLKIKRDSGYVSARGRLISYIRRSSKDSLLKAGMVLLMRSNLLELQGPKNPGEFNYRNYLSNRQIHFTTFVDSGAYVPLPGPKVLNPVWETGLACKQYILEQLKKSPLSETSYAICAALLTGYDDEIDRSVMESFSHSGTLHVLSVSGLHTGLIYLALGFLFDLADRKRKYKLLRFFLISGVLWFFALITGFSSPVLRAVIMFNLLGLGRIFFRNDIRNQVNILCVSAFMLLCYDPFFITDVGFLLSYFALFGLIYFQPKLAAPWQPRQPAVNMLWQSITASVAATLSTLPLTLFYFKQFPLWFFVCNVVVVPATFVMLLLALLVVLKLSLAAVLINYLVDWLVSFIGLFNSERYGFIDRIDFNLMDAIYLSLLIVLASAALRARSYRLVVAGLCLLICWQVNAFLSSYTAKQQSGLSVYQAGRESARSLKNKSEALVNPLSPANYNYHIKPHVTSFNNASLSVRDFNYVRSGDQSVLVLHQPRHWPAADLKEITTLIIGNNFVLTEAELSGFQKLRCIVADGSNNTRTIQKTSELCRKFGIGFYDTKSSGAYLLSLDR
jgi:competence protein ComEC